MIKKENLHNYSGLIAIISMCFALLAAKSIDYFIPPLPSKISFLFVPLIGSWLVLVIITFFSSPAQRTSAGLQATGIYAVIRNPLYTITLLLLYPALCLLLRSYSGFLFIIPLFFVFRYITTLEDTFLETILGQYYINYEEKTGIFFPLLFRKR